MRDNKEAGAVRHKRSPSARPTIGLLIDWLGGGYQSLVWTGVADVAEERDVNLICFAGGSLRTPYGFLAQSNALFDLVSGESVDGLVIVSGALSEFVNFQELVSFCERFRSLPMVSMALTLEGIPSVLVDNKRGMRDAIDHLVQTHGYRRIAFIRGPEGHQEADQRYRAYTEALAEHGISFNPEFVVPGDFGLSTGREAIRLLLDQRGVDLEAVVAADDSMALGALEALQARGIRVPNDVALVGFDDVEEARFLTPSLTTVRQPVYEQGKRATEMLLAQLANESVPEQVMLPTQLIVRQSCGCQSPAVAQAEARSETLGVSKTLRALPLSEIVPAIEASLTDSRGVMGTDWARQLVDSFVAELQAGASKSFLSVLDGILHQVMEMEGDIASWQGVLSALRRQLLPFLSDDEALSRAEDLWQQARVLVGEMAEQKSAYQRLQAERRSIVVNEVGQSLLTTHDMGELMDVVTENLPQVGVKSCYIALYDDPQAPAEWSQLILAYSDGERTELGVQGGRFPSLQLVPDDLLPLERRYTMAAESIYFREDQLGFALFEMGPRDSGVYATLRRQISSALKDALLLQEREQAEAALKEAYAGVERQVEERTIALQQEIAERKQVEKELRRYREHLEELVEERTRELKETQAQLIHRERLSILGQLTATVAHEIRNPLGTVRTAVFAIGDAIEQDEMGRVERALRLAERNIHRCDDIIRELLDYSRDWELRLTHRPIDTWLNEVLDEQDIPADIVCVREWNAGVRVLMDVEHLRRAVINVVVNAVDALRDVGDAGKGAAESSNDEEAVGKRLTVGTYVVGDRVEIRVSDTGCGIPPDVLPKVFEPFFSTKGFGVGLGLSIVKDIMGRHGGGVEIESRLRARPSRTGADGGQSTGTTVTLWLPISSAGGD